MKLTVDNFLFVCGPNMSLDIRIAPPEAGHVVRLVKLEASYWTSSYRLSNFDPVVTGTTVEVCLRQVVNKMKLWDDKPDHIDLSVFDRTRLVLSESLNEQVLEELRRYQAKPGQMIKAIESTPRGTRHDPLYGMWIQAKKEYRKGRLSEKLYDMLERRQDKEAADYVDYQLRGYPKLYDNPNEASKALRRRASEQAKKAAEPEPETYWDEYYDSLPDAE